jgi:predicted dehydrogenase
VIRIGLVGCGFIAAIHSRALKALMGGGLVDAAVVATCDRDQARAEAFARAHEAEVATDDLGRLLEAVDAVYVCTPTAGHLAAVEAAADAGVAVFCEKPLAPSLPEAEAVAAAVAGQAKREGTAEADGGEIGYAPGDTAEFSPVR